MIFALRLKQAVPSNNTALIPPCPVTSRWEPFKAQANGNAHQPTTSYAGSKTAILRRHPVRPRRRQICELFSVKSFASPCLSIVDHPLTMLSTHKVSDSLVRHRRYGPLEDVDKDNKLTGKAWRITRLRGVVARRGTARLRLVVAPMSWRTDSSPQFVRLTARK
ncbi:DNA repair and recombination protein RAD26 [Pseudozyma hubeiensis SY62]|uniref:DNA repair and recombination protein RAD26 n=1 Tax=Pseudozyma hubeiensis (strain SY62) TaxID=1305764 RepID=R9PDC6_PSEHS|nr:DNA repair and recombination protein RAD26 [Pseudozyma hubeiensis SY62]GAC99373.1 DNA repair and recombination protein RAD26 [Pseudozyma hubeiensis SY62]